MITINHPSVQTEGNAVTISYPILQDGHAPRTLSFTVDSRFRDFLNPGRADGALVALLPWISQQGGQVRVLPAISAHLYHFGIRLLSHILTGIGPFLKPVELAGEVHAEVLSPIPGCRIGTGGSLGVYPAPKPLTFPQRMGKRIKHFLYYKKEDAASVRIKILGLRIYKRKKEGPLHQSRE